MNRKTAGIISSIHVGRTIEAPASVVWRLLVDTRQWPVWGPSVKAVETDHPIIGPGTRGYVISAGGLKMPFEITRYESGRYWSWRVGRIRATGHMVVTLDARRCCLIFEIPVWAAPYATVCLLAIKRIQNSLEGTAGRG